VSSLYSGMTLVAKASAINRVTKFPISSPICMFNFFQPPKSPKDNPSDRVPDFSFQGIFDPAQNMYVAYIDTDDWLAGNWWYQAVLTAEPYTAWEFSTFKLLP
jgi:hypothetical protein